MRSFLSLGALAVVLMTGSAKAGGQGGGLALLGIGEMNCRDLTVIDSPRFKDWVSRWWSGLNSIQALAKTSAILTQRWRQR